MAFKPEQAAQIRHTNTFAQQPQMPRLSRRHRQGAIVPKPLKNICIIYRQTSGHAAEAAAAAAAAVFVRETVCVFLVCT